MHSHSSSSFGELWRRQLHLLSQESEVISPRGFPCRERIGVTLHLNNALNNVLVDPTRRLNYRFMVAEWLYIWFGHDDVRTIARFNPNIAQFSDNGTDFNGAYGPPVVKQWERLVGMLAADHTSRQAVLQIYKTPTGKTKDVPCTLALQFLVRNRKLHTIATMRSSDIWLGLPYDVFNFTMLGNTLASQLRVEVGEFTIHLGSSHLYEKDRMNALRVLAENATSTRVSPVLPHPPPQWLDAMLMGGLTSYGPAVTVWQSYGRALWARTSVEALKELSCV